jgi:hypothetical protein
MNSENKYLLLISVGPKIASSCPKTECSRPVSIRSLSPVRPASFRRLASSEQQRSKVGFPIRKFTDQSLFAAPHDLSQRTTSFIASQRQGIHQIPLRHLIALIAKARIFVCRSIIGIVRQRTFWLEKTSFASNASGDLSGQAPNPRLVARKTRRGRDAFLACGPSRIRRLDVSPHPAVDRMRFLFTMSEIKRQAKRRRT